eukprot:1736833-Amphidinium_carterae.1
MPRASCTITVAEVAKTIMEIWSALATLEPNMPEAMVLATMGPALHSLCTATRRLNASIVEQACVVAGVPSALMLPRFLCAGFQHMVSKHRFKKDGSHLTTIEDACCNAKPEKG